MKKHLLFFVIFISSYCSNAQEFFKYYGHFFHSGTYSFPVSDNGNVIISMTSTSFSIPDRFIHIIKTDSAGNIVWNKLINEGDSSVCMGGFGLEISSGGYLFSGTWQGATINGSFLMKMDVNGNLLWIKVYPINAPGWVDFDALYVLETVDHGFVFNGSSQIVKVDSSGEVVWIRDYSSALAPISGFCRGQFVQTTDAGFLFMFNSGGSGGLQVSDVVLIKTDSSGEVQWGKRYSDTTNFTLTNLYEMSDGYLFAKGLSLIKTDFSGDTLWTKSFATNPITARIYFVPKGDKIIVSTMQNGWTTHDLTLFQTDSFGEIEWSRTYHENALNDFHWVHKSGSGFIVNGRYHNQGFPSLMKTDSLGYAGCNTDTTRIPLLPNNIQVSVDSIISDSVPLVTYQTPIPVISDSGFVSYVCGGVSVSEIDVEHMLSVYPNPGNGKIKVVSDYDWNELIASDITGRIIYKKKIDGHFHDLDLTFLGRGLYVLNFSWKDHQSRIVKLIIN